MNPQLEVILSVLSYSICSGTLVLLNKLTLHYLPFPSLVVCVQLVATLIFIYGAKLTRILEVDTLKWKFVVPYLYYIILFSVGVYWYVSSRVIGYQIRWSTLGEISYTFSCSISFSRNSIIAT